MFRFLLILCCIAPLWAQKDPTGSEERITIGYGVDRNIKIDLNGRAGNVDFMSSAVEKEGEVLTNYQEGRGYMRYNRDTQELRGDTNIKFTLNQLASYIQRTAPYSWIKVPKGTELDLDVDVYSMGHGSFDFAEMDIKHFKVDVHFGDIDLTFPTVNNSIVRGPAKFALSKGDMEIYQLANIKADKVRINGGVGDVYVDFGPKLLADMEVFMDHDIGKLELVIPRGTRVRIWGTTRDLTELGFDKSQEKIGWKTRDVWNAKDASANSPLLDIQLRGPLGDFYLTWK